MVQYDGKHGDGSQAVDVGSVVSYGHGQGCTETLGQAKLLFFLKAKDVCDSGGGAYFIPTFAQEFRGSVTYREGAVIDLGLLKG